MVLYAPTNSSPYVVRFQNNIQSIFNRVRLLYGATPQEDILQYNVLVRALTEWTATNQMGSLDNTSIADGVGGYTYGALAENSVGTAVVAVNTRQSYIQGLSSVIAANNTSGNVPQTTQVPAGASSSGTFCTRRYQVNFALGVFTQDKLIPTKYMASQLAIEITLEQANACIYQPIGYGTNSVNPTYTVGNINLIPEIIEFDDSYDIAFLQGLETGGVPIKFSTWHYFQFGNQGSSSLQLQITERSRSVKGIFAVQRRQPQGFQYDSHALLMDSNTSNISVGSTMQQFQYRIGGRYFPAAPVQIAANVGSSVCTGGAEAYVELEKFLNIVGDYRLKPNTSVLNWAVPASSSSATLPEFDYTKSVYGFDAYGMPLELGVETSTSNLAGNQPSAMFAAAINFETSNGIEISGLNAEEQSDISFNVIWSAGQTLGFSIECFTYVDVMWVLRVINFILTYSQIITLI